MTRNRPLLDPYCLHCGEYKGVGYCLDPTCKGSLESEDGGDHTSVANITSSPREHSAFCQVCREHASFKCWKCNSGYCEEHAGNARESVMSGLGHHIGLCSICQELVCENCWILDEKGHIICLDHSEEE